MVVRPNRSIGDAIVPQIATKFTKIPLLHSGRKDILENLLPLLLLVRTNLFCLFRAILDYPYEV